jgi:ABC-2 type transport system permease protein
MIRVEFRKQTVRWRTYVALGLMIAIPTLLTLAFKLRGPPGDRREHDFFALATHSGLNMPLAALSMMTTFLLPLVIVIFAGSAIAEEASWGTVRYLLVRPVSRSHFLTSKLIVAAAMACVATGLIVLTGTIEGMLAFGWHPVVTPSGAIISPGTALGRLFVATLFVAWSMSGILAFSFLISAIADAAMGAVAAGLGLAIIAQILDAIPPLGRIRSFLPTHYWHAWEGLYSTSVPTDHLVRGVLLQLPYVIVFLALTWWWFHRKDILT